MFDGKMWVYTYIYSVHVYLKMKVEKGLPNCETFALPNVLPGNPGPHPRECWLSWSLGSLNEIVSHIWVNFIWKRSHQWKKLVGRDGWLVVKMPILDSQSCHYEKKAPTLQLLVLVWFSPWFVSVGGEGWLFNDSKQIRETRGIFGKQPKQPCDITSNDSSHGIIQWLKFTGQFWDRKIWRIIRNKNHRNQGFLRTLPVVTILLEHSAWHDFWAWSSDRSLEPTSVQPDFGCSHVLSTKD